jgi:hypothetical protein
MIPFLFLILVNSAVAFITPSSHHCNVATYRQQSAPVIHVPSTHHTNLNLFGFGKEDKVDEEELQGVNELARFSYELSSSDIAETKYDSLSNMISSWSKVFFTDDGKKKSGLTTPVTLVEIGSKSDADKALVKAEEAAAIDAHDVSDPGMEGAAMERAVVMAADMYDGISITKHTGVKLLFKKVNTGYKDKDDEKNKDEKKKKEKVKKEGGVEIRISQLSDGNLQVVASRCDLDEDTMIKEMSEQAIIDSLRKAWGAWKKEQVWQ